MKFLLSNKYLKRLFAHKANPAQANEGDDDSKSRLIKRFFNEGFAFWHDPFDSYRKNFVTRAGPAF